MSTSGVTTESLDKAIREKLQATHVELVDVSGELRQRGSITSHPQLVKLLRGGDY
jgi:hypothetical protein